MFAGVAQVAAAGACVPDEAGDDVLLVPFSINDVVLGADPEVFERSQRYFGSVVDHRWAFDDVAANLAHIRAGPPFANWANDAVLDLAVFSEQVLNRESPFQVIPGFRQRWDEVSRNGLQSVPDCRTHEDLFARLLQEPGGVNLSWLSLGSLFVVALFSFAGFPGQYNLESCVDLLRLVPGGLRTSSSLSLSAQ